MLQQRSKCSDSTCKDIVSTFAKYMNISVPKQFHRYDRELNEEAGAQFMILNGCVGCHRVVYTPDDKRTHCSRVDEETGEVCGHPRFDEHGKAFEVCCCLSYLPLLPPDPLPPYIHILSCLIPCLHT